MNVQEIVTSKIIEALDRGVVPWSKPWVTNGRGERDEHRNYISGHRYTGVNRLLLGITGYSCPFWVTYKQAQERGGQVRKGEKSTLIVFWKIVEAKRKSTNEEQKTFPVLRYYNVFNLEQVDGIEWSLDDKALPEQSVADAPAIVKQYVESDGPRVEHLYQDRAFYRPAEDMVMMPMTTQFENEDAYFQTLFHELVHSTGHSSRLNRTGGSFGDERYAKEELVAEMGASMLMMHAGRQPRIDESAAYIDSWRQRLSRDASLILTAASAAEKAVAFVVEDRVSTEQVA